MITTSGEKEGVLKSIEFAKSVHADMDANAKTVSIEVSKSQHKNIIGQKGNIFCSLPVTVLVRTSFLRQCRLELVPPCSPLLLSGSFDQLGLPLFHAAATILATKSSGDWIVEKTIF
uniref:Uncharacterized protein n=1 Tax=Cacopsylla melanoneura TaxID=428564 RepID=A0A8D9F5L5_9HEMI